MRYILFILLSLNLFAVDATLKIETDVEHRTRLSIEDGSSTVNDKFFKILLSDLKISGHFLAKPAHNRADLNSNFISPSLRNSEYVLKYSLNQSRGTKLTVRLLKSPNGAEVFTKSYAIPSRDKAPFLAHKAISDINDILKYV